VTNARRCPNMKRPSLLQTYICFLTIQRLLPVYIPSRT
jgi:hypothetical protein